MNTLTLIQQAWNKAEGEVYPDSEGSDTWKSALTYANYYIPVWAHQYGVDWVSLYDPIYEVGTVEATDTYDLDPDEVRKLSPETNDFVRILHTDGVTYSNYKVVPASQLQANYNNRACAKVGATLKFSRPFLETDPQFGGTITAPIYGNPPLLTTGKSIVPVDHPEWLVCMVAYDIALHDILRKDTANSHLADAADIFNAMKSENNDAQENRLNETSLSFIGDITGTISDTSYPF